MHHSLLSAYNEDMQGEVVEVLCEGWDAEAMCYAGRSYAESPDIDGKVFFTASKNRMNAGSMGEVEITDYMECDLLGEMVEG